MTFCVFTEEEVIGRYQRTPSGDKWRMVGVLADLTASTREEMSEWLKNRGVWTNAKPRGSGCYERKKKKAG